MQQKITVYRYLLFFFIFIVVYGPILAPILIQIAYAVHTHKQFKMIAFYSKAIKTLGKKVIYVS